MSGATAARARLHRAAVRCAEGEPGADGELEAAAAAAVRTGAGVDARLAHVVGQAIGADPALGEALARWLAAGIDLAMGAPEYFARTIVAAEHHMRERRRLGPLAGGGRRGRGQSTGELPAARPEAAAPPVDSTQPARTSVDQSLRASGAGVNDPAVPGGPA